MGEKQGKTRDAILKRVRRKLLQEDMRLKSEVVYRIVDVEGRYRYSTATSPIVDIESFARALGVLDDEV